MSIKMELGIEEIKTNEVIGYIENDELTALLKIRDIIENPNEMLEKLSGGNEAESSGKNDAESIISDVLTDIGIAAHLNGRNYIKTAVLILMETDGKLGMTTELYPSVAQKHSVTASRVEKGIRDAVKTAWEKGGGENSQDLFKKLMPRGKKPKNSDFLYALADFVKESLQGNAE